MTRAPNRPSLLSDDLVRHLVAVGQVDLLVGLPSYNNAATIGGVTRQVQEALARQFVRERTLILNVDAGSADGTADVVREVMSARGDPTLATEALRTIHGVTAPYHGLEGKSNALRTVFTAADLLQARAVVVVDPEVTSIRPEWIQRLAQPVLQGSADFVGPRYVRHPLDGPLVTQVVRPLVRTLYARRMQEPLAAEFGASAAFVARVLSDPIWNDEAFADGIDLWLSLHALAAEARCAEAPLGPRVVEAARARPSLAVSFAQIVATLFACAERHAPAWTNREGSEVLPLLGAPDGAAPPAPDLDVDAIADSARRALPDLQPVLTEALPGPLVERIGAAIGPSATPFTDDLWAEVLGAFVLADHHHALPRRHLAQALLPLYLGRTASFLAEARDLAPDAAERRLEALAEAVERTRPDLVGRWTAETRR